MKQIVSLLFFILIGSQLFAQVIIDTRPRGTRVGHPSAPRSHNQTGMEVQFIPTIGYQTAGSIDFLNNNFRVQDNMSYGGILAFGIRPDVWFELQYTRIDTEGRLRNFFSGDRFYYDMSVDYFQLGGRKVFRNADNVELFGTYTLGATLFNVKESGIDDVWRFSMAFGLGTTFYVNDRIGLRLQARLLMPMYFEDSGLFIGIGGGGSTGLVLSGTSVMVQGDFSGGLVFRLGQ